MITPLPRNKISSHSPNFVPLRRFIKIASMLTAQSQDAAGKGQVGWTAKPQALTAPAYSTHRREAFSARIPGEKE
jgi:hypothetical protein